jgi:hypothetical protein
MKLKLSRLNLSEVIIGVRYICVFIEVNAYSILRLYYVSREKNTIPLHLIKLKMNG